MCIGTDFIHTWKGWAVHGTEHAACELEPGQLCEHFKSGCIDRNIATSGNDLMRLPFNMLFFY